MYLCIYLAFPPIDLSLPVSFLSTNLAVHLSGGLSVHLSCFYLSRLLSPSMKTHPGPRTFTSNHPNCTDSEGHRAVLKPVGSGDELSTTSLVVVLLAGLRVKTKTLCKPEGLRVWGLGLSNPLSWGFRISTLTLAHSRQGISGSYPYYCCYSPYH